jgi:hypothetical protein
MALIELTTFRVLEGVEESTFLDADERARTSFLYRQRGLVRATTARGEDGWATVTTWWSAAEADAAEGAAVDDPAATELAALLDPGSVRRQRWTTLD